MTRRAVVVLLAAHTLLTVWSARRESATYDEVPHIAGGYSHVALADHRHDLGGEPPLAKLLAGLAVATLAPPLPSDRPAWRGCNPQATCRFATALLYEGGDGRAILWRARLPFAILSLVLAVTVYAWSRALFGAGAGLGALALYAFNPEFLAHAHYVGSDLALALASTLLLWAAWRFAEQPRPGRGLAVAGAFALAVVTKFSFPALALMALALAAVRWRWPGAGRPRLVPGVASLIALVLAVAALSYLAVWSVYRFRATAAASPDLGCDMTIETLLPGGGSARRVLVAARDRRFLPEAYATGLALRVNESDGRRLSFVAGEARQGRTWFYFPLALALKTPLALLVLAAIGAIRLAREDRPALLALAAAAGVYLALAMAARFNIGYRHLLPLLPILLVVAGAGFAGLWARPDRRWIGVLLLAWQVVATLRVAPHFLSYFNELAGGPAGASRYLVDSNLDWGQDLEELTRVCRQRGFTAIKLSYFGNASPDAAGVPYAAALPSVTSCWDPRAWASEVVAGDVIAVSLTNLRLAYFQDHNAYPTRVELPGTSGEMGFGHLMRYIDARYRPAARAGWSIRIYHLTPEWERR